MHSKDDLLELIKTGEGYTLEFKESLNSSIGKEICAFANASGGTILLGVKDNGSIKGYRLNNTDSSKIQNIVRNMDPSFNVMVEQVSDIVIVYVSEGKEKPYAVNGHFYLRIGSNSQQLKRDEIRAFFQKENIIRFDCKANIDFVFKSDFDDKAFKYFIIKARIDSNLPKYHILNNLGLITDGKINNAAVLLFSHNISKFFLNSIISCVLYETTTKTKIIDSADFDSGFVSNFNNAVIFALRNLRTEYIIKTIEREEKQEIPEEVLRELIINAMTHRDYFSEGRILLEIYPDRIEISNPGSLLFNINDFGKTSLSRNPLLVDMVHRLRFVERVGSGISRVKDLLRDKIEFEISANWFRVIIKRNVLLGAPVNAPVNAPVKITVLQKSLLFEIKNNSQVTYDELSLRLNTHRTTIMRNISTLKEKGKLKRVGPDKGGHWEVLK